MPTSFSFLILSLLLFATGWADTVCKDKHSDCHFYRDNGDCNCDPIKNGDCYWQKHVRKICPRSCGVCSADEDIPTGGKGCGIKCPEYEGLFPHPNECSKFIHCAHGHPYVKDCPASLHFNPTLLVCDWPDRAGCEAGTGETSKEGECEVIPTAKPPCKECQPIPNICKCSCCLLDHPDDCSAYYRCENWQAYLQRCSPGLIFSPYEENCVPESAYTCPLSNCDCPEGCGVFPVPSGENCGSYCHCVEGHGQIKDCPAGLHFNPVTTVCDFPETVGCKKGENKPDCHECSNGCTYPVQGNCAEYWYCANGEAVKKNCHEGFYFNPDKRTCDHLKNVDCDHGTVRTLIHKQEVREVEDNVPECKFGDGYVPKKFSCSQYYTCKGGKGTLHTCPKGWSFYTHLKRCVPGGC